MSAPCQAIIGALANLYTMLTEYRGLEPHPDVAALFARWAEIRRLPIDMPHYGLICELSYRLNLLVIDPKQTSAATTAAMRSRRLDGAWLAMHARNLLFVQPSERAPTHRGITYSLALVVLTAMSGQEAMSKLDLARLHMNNSIEALKARGASVGSARIIRLAFGRAGKNVVPVRADNELVSTEAWFTSELQANPMLHELVPRHRVYAQMSADERAELPVSTQKAAAGDTSKLDVLRATDPVARWHGFVAGQVICVDRRHLFEGGVGFALRCVR
jgi:DNA-directed RNA polymerase subunit H (RpoH/RPB5)